MNEWYQLFIDLDFLSCSGKPSLIDAGLLVCASPQPPVCFLEKGSAQEEPVTGD